MSSLISPPFLQSLQIQPFVTLPPHSPVQPARNQNCCCRQCKVVIKRIYGPFSCCRETLHGNEIRLRNDGRDVDRDTSAAKIPGAWDPSIAGKNTESDWYNKSYETSDHGEGVNDGAGFWGKGNYEN